MINEYLFNACEEYNKYKKCDILIDFSSKTFPNDGTDKLFIGCSLILFNLVINKNYATSEALLTILKSGKKKVGKTNLLEIYYNRINNDKMVSKYLKKQFSNENYEKNLDILIDYFERWGFNFDKVLSIYTDKINEYKD